MTRLPQTIDFNEADHPGLTHIFHELDLGIAAIIASDPAFRPKATKRRSRSATATGSAVARPRRSNKSVVAA